VLVPGQAGDGTWGSRLRRLLAFGGAAVGVTGAAFAGAAVLSNGLSLDGVLTWFTHPRIGGAQGRFNTVGWGGAGLVTAVTGQPQASAGLPPTTVAIALTVAAVGVAGLRGLAALARPGIRRVVAAALILNAGLAFVEASWRQALRADYWALGLVPLAVLGAIGGPVLPRRTGRVLPVRAAALVAALALVAGVAASSLRTEVIPSLSDSRRQGRAVAAIARHLPPRAIVIVTSPLSGRLATMGFEASSAWGILAQRVARGSSRPGLDGLLRDARLRPLFVSRLGFRLQKQQAAFLHRSPRPIWRALGRCARLEPVLNYLGPAGPETLYKVAGPVTFPCRVGP